MGGLRSPTGRLIGAPSFPKNTEVRFLPRRDPYPSFHFGIRADYAALECKKCRACGELVLNMCLAFHCRQKNDAAHLALEVMET